jgi:hypothetical protein
LLLFVILSYKTAFYGVFLAIVLVSVVACDEQRMRWSTRPARGWNLQRSEMSEKTPAGDGSRRKNQPEA